MLSKGLVRLPYNSVLLDLDLIGLGLEMNKFVCLFSKVIVTHTVRQLLTSGVSDEVVTTYTPVVTSLVTEYSFTGVGKGEDTAVITSTSTPVRVEHLTSYIMFST